MASYAGHLSLSAVLGAAYGSAGAYYYQLDWGPAILGAGLTTIGGVFFWSWPIVAVGQLLVALGWAELSSHYPVAGSVLELCLT